jgi:hypothetical protein
VLESRETCPWLILGCSKNRCRRKPQKVFCSEGLGHMILRNLRVAWKSSERDFQCVLYGKASETTLLNAASPSPPPLAEFGGKCLNQPHSSLSAFPTSPILILMKRTMINDSSNNTNPCCNRDTTLNLRLRDGFQHLLVQELVATPALLRAFRTPRMRETLQLHSLENSINIATSRMNLIDLPVHVTFSNKYQIPARPSFSLDTVVYGI